MATSKSTKRTNGDAKPAKPPLSSFERALYGSADAHRASKMAAGVPHTGWRDDTLHSGSDNLEGKLQRIPEGRFRNSAAEAIERGHKVGRMIDLGDGQFAYGSIGPPRDVPLIDSYKKPYNVERDAGGRLSDAQQEDIADRNILNLNPEELRRVVSTLFKNPAGLSQAEQQRRLDKVSDTYIADLRGGPLTQEEGWPNKAQQQPLDTVFNGLSNEEYFGSGLNLDAFNKYPSGQRVDIPGLGSSVDRLGAGTRQPIRAQEALLEQQRLQRARQPGVRTPGQYNPYLNPNDPFFIHGREQRERDELQRYMAVDPREGDATGGWGGDRGLQQPSIAPHPARPLTPPDPFPALGLPSIEESSRKNVNSLLNDAPPVPRRTPAGQQTEKGGQSYTAVDVSHKTIDGKKYFTQPDGATFVGKGKTFWYQGREVRSKRPLIIWPDGRISPAPKEFGNTPKFLGRTGIPAPQSQSLAPPSIEEESLNNVDNIFGGDPRFDRVGTPAAAAATRNRLQETASPIVPRGSSAGGDTTGYGYGEGYSTYWDRSQPRQYRPQNRSEGLGSFEPLGGFKFR